MLRVIVLIAVILPHQTWKKKETLVEEGASGSSGVGKLALAASAFGGAAAALALVAFSGALSNNAPRYERLPMADYNPMA